MTKRISALLLSFVFVLAVLCTSLQTQEVFAYPAPNDGERHKLCTALSDQANEYYVGGNTYDALSALSGDGSGSSLTATGSELYKSLHGLMSDTQTDFVTYKSLTDYWNYTDTVRGSTNPVLFYSDVESSAFNREHVWPKSHASYEKTNGGADLHHLRPADSTINSTRGNHTFGDVKGVLATHSTKDYNGKTVLWYSAGADLAEVSDNIKGDVARVLLYIYVRWEQPNLFEKVSSSQLPANDSGSSNDGQPVIESMETLLEWCRNDPVDEWEMVRNDRVQDVQGNRNVFIDYPEFAWLLFGEQLPSSMKTPSGKAATSGTDYTVSAVSDNVSHGTVSVSGNRVIASPAEGYAATDYVLSPADAATVTQNGNYFVLSNIKSDCTLTVKFTERTSATVSFAVPEGISVANINAHVGDKVVLPSVSGSVEGYEFVGYTDTPVQKTETVPTYFAAGDEYTVAGDALLYALFMYRDENGVGGTADGFTKLTSASDDISGTYLIVYEKGGKAFDASLAKPDAAGNNFDVTITDGVISGAYADKAVTVEKVEGGYTIRTANGLYIGSDTDDRNVLSSSAETKYINTITVTDGETDIVSAAGSHLRYNVTSGQDRFRYFKSATYTNQQPVALYKATSSAVRYYLTLAEAKPPVQPVQGDLNGDNEVNELDYMLVKRAVLKLVQLTSSQIEAADMDGDKLLTAFDYVLVKRRALGLI